VSARSVEQTGLRSPRRTARADGSVPPLLTGSADEGGAVAAAGAPAAAPPGAVTRQARASRAVNRAPTHRGGGHRNGGPGRRPVGRAVGWCGDTHGHLLARERGAEYVGGVPDAVLPSCSPPAAAAKYGGWKHAAHLFVISNAVRRVVETIVVRVMGRQCGRRPQSADGLRALPPEGACAFGFKASKEGGDSACLSVGAPPAEFYGLTGLANCRGLCPVSGPPGTAPRP
jgi:hypothetical protein